MTDRAETIVEAMVRAAALEEAARLVETTDSLMRPEIARRIRALSPALPEQTREGGGEPGPCRVCGHAKGCHLDGVSECMERWGAPGECQCPAFIHPSMMAPTPPAPAETTANPSKEPAP